MEQVISAAVFALATLVLLLSFRKLGPTGKQLECPVEVHTAASPKDE